MGYKFVGEAAGNATGIAVSSAGDIDADGLADVIIGATGSLAGSPLSFSGRAYLVLGADMAAFDAADGVADGVIKLANIMATGGSYTLKNSAAAQAKLGESVASLGDIDGDGKSEVVIGGSSGSTNASGVTYLLNPANLAAMDAADGTVDQVVDLDRNTAASGSYEFMGEKAADASGRVVSSAGDVDGDGKNDLLIGASMAGDASDNSGIAYLINANDLAALDAADGATDGKIQLSQVAATGTSYRFLGEALADRAGFDVSAVGDVNGDGKADFVVTSELSTSAPAFSGTGRAYLISGNELAALDAADGTSNGNIALANVARAANSFKFVGGVGGDFDAATVSAAGDVDNDGTMDLLVADPRANALTGRVHLVKGADLAALDAADGASDGTILLSQVAPTGTSYTIVASGGPLSSRFGESIRSAGDVDGDGLGDLLISEQSATGTTYLALGKDLAALDAADGTTDGRIVAGNIALVGSGKRFFGEVVQDFAGDAISSAGDVDGDGKSDLLIGAHGVDDTGALDAGAAYVLKAALLDQYDSRDGLLDRSIQLAQSVFDHDTTAPAAPVVTKITTDTGTSSTDRITNDPTLVIEGTAEPGALVTVFGNGTSLTGATPVTADASGNWSYDHTATSLPEGNFSITAQAKDAAGNTGSVSSAFVVVVDTTAPSAPVVTGISDDTGASSSDGTTTDQTLQIMGTAEANASVNILVDGASIGSTTADGAGNWTFDNTANSLNAGTYAVTATATDVAGNTSPASAAFSVTIIAPSGPSLSAIDLIDASDDGTSNTDDKTSDTTPSVSYTAEAGAKVEVDFGDGKGFVAVADGTGAAQTETLGTAYTSEGVKTIQVRATNAAAIQTTTTLDITINLRPTDVTLSNASIADGSGAGTVVGAVAVQDSTPGDTHILQLTDSAGGLFALNGTQIEVAAGATISAASGQLKSIGLRATDSIGGVVDKTLNLTVLSPSGDITDGDTSSTLSGDGANNTIDAAGGDDTITGGGGQDQITLGPGNDTLLDSVANMNGDTISDFSASDTFQFQGATFKRGNLTVTETGGMTQLAIDADGDGTTDATINLSGTLTGGAFMVASHGGDTFVTYQPLLPSLSEQMALDTALVNGVANQGFLTGDGSKSFQVTVDAAAVASHKNAIGFYEVTSTGDIVDVSVAVADASTAGGQVVTLSSVDAGHKLGVFLIQDGASFAAGLAATDTLSFADTSGAPANTGAGTALDLLVNGASAGQTTFHSFARHLNGDGVEHVASGTDTTGSKLLLGFEDLTAGGDMDYQDVLLSVDIL